MRLTIKLNKQRGSVSLFVVIFSALLITIISVSFVRIMIKDQQQATATDLSQSAYDSAQAGVEDSKRALLRYQNICSTGTDAECTAAKAIINSLKCNDAVKTLNDVVTSGSGSEVKVQTAKESTSGGNSLDQAYTCTKVLLDTPDYLGTLSANESRVIPLDVVAGKTFDRIQIQWFNSNDLNSADNTKIGLSLNALGLSSSWTPTPSSAANINKPPILRTQLIQTDYSGVGFTLSSFDDLTNPARKGNSNTLFFYPNGSSGVANTTAINSKNAALDTRQDPRTNIAPNPITCSGDIAAGGYSCTVQLVMPKEGNANKVNSLLRLTPIYGKSNFRVTLLDGTTPVNFNGVQPQIDSTGRANSLYRRLQTRVELADTNFPYPEAAVDITGSFCKNFWVTDNVADFADSAKGGNNFDAVTGKINGCTP